MTIMKNIWSHPSRQMLCAIMQLFVAYESIDVSCIWIQLYAFPGAPIIHSATLQI
jgi:hypothetical protein